MSNQDPNDFLMGGGGAPSAKFKTIGDTHRGVITGLQVRQQLDFATKKPKFWDDGNPQMQLEVTIATEERDATIDNDDGKRRIFVKGQMLAAVRDAVRKVGESGLREGGTFVVRYIADKPSGLGNDAKQFEAAYKPPANNDATADALLNGAATEAAPLDSVL